MADSIDIPHLPGHERRELHLTARGWKSYTWEQQEKICQRYNVILDNYMTRNERIHASARDIMAKLRSRHERRQKRRNMTGTIQRILGALQGTDSKTGCTSVWDALKMLFGPRHVMSELSYRHPRPRLFPEHGPAGRRSGRKRRSSDRWKGTGGQSDGLHMFSTKKPKLFNDEPDIPYDGEPRMFSSKRPRLF